MAFIHRTAGLIVYGFPRDEIKEKDVRLSNIEEIIPYVVDE